MGVLRILFVGPSELYASSSAASMTAKTASSSSCGEDRFCNIRTFKGVSSSGIFLPEWKVHNDAMAVERIYVRSIWGTGCLVAWVVGPRYKIFGILRFLLRQFLERRQCQLGAFGFWVWAARWPFVPDEVQASFTTLWTFEFNVIRSRRTIRWRKYTRTGWTGIGARIRNCVEPGAQLRVSRKLLGSMRTMIKRSEKRRLEPFSPVRRVAEGAGLFRMPVLWRVGRSWQLIWRQPGALARGLRDKFEIGKSALEIPYGRRMEDIVHTSTSCQSTTEQRATSRTGSTPLPVHWRRLDGVILEAMVYMFPLEGMLSGSSTSTTALDDGLHQKCSKWRSPALREIWP